MNVAVRFSGTGDLVADFYADAVAVRKACLHFSENWCFEECKKEETCVEEALLGLLKE